MSIVNTYTLNVDLKRKMTSVVPTFRQGDAARLAFKVFDDGKGVDISTFTRAEIYHELSNGETLQGDCEIGEEYITYDYSGVEMQFVGFINTMIVLRSENTETSIEPFKVYIYDSMKAENLSYVNILQEMIKETQGLGVDLSQLMFDFESYDYSPTQNYVFPNLVLHNGSTYIALQDVVGIEPNDDKVSWRLVSLKGTVNTVNGVMPEGNGNIALTPSTIGAASSTELIQVEQTLTEQLSNIAVNVNTFPRLAVEVVDTGRIQRAINYVSEQGGGTALFTDFYTVNSTINVPSDVKILGGYGNYVKVADDCTGFYALFSIHSAENVTVEGINYDGNVERDNYAISLSKPEIAVYIVNSKHVKVINNHFKTCGVWTVSCEVSEAFPYNDYIYIQDNVVDYTVGKTTARVNPMLRIDTTQFYVDAKNYWVERNTLNTLNAMDDIAETAIEAHRTLGTVRDNVINGFKNGVLVVPGFFEEEYEKSLISVENNKMYNVLQGVTLWQVIQKDLENVKVDGNTIEIDINRFYNAQAAYGIGVLDTLPRTGLLIDDAKITNNTIKFLPYNATLNSDYTHNFVGIKMRGYVSLKDIKISNNQIIDSPSIGIYVGMQGSAEYPNTIEAVDIHNNTIINAGKNENIATTAHNVRTPIRINGFAGGLCERLVCKDNTIIDTKEVGTYFTRDITINEINQDTCAITNNNFICNGKELLNVKRDYNLPFGWDSQLGNPVVNKSASYIKTNNGVKFNAFIDVTDMSNFTQGYGFYITLPIAPIQAALLPIAIFSTEATQSSMWFVELFSGNKIAYIRAISSSNTMGSLGKALVKVGTKVSINIEYLA